MATVTEQMKQDAKKIANHIANCSQSETEAMITIIAEIHNYDWNMLYRVVGNMYMTTAHYKENSNVAITGGIYEGVNNIR